MRPLLTDRQGVVRHRFGFVMEQTLGHVTHYKNMRAAIDAESGVDATWYPLLFPPREGLETLPPIRGNWSVRASLRVRRLLARDDAAERYDALFFHTQVTTLLSVPLMRRVPTVVSLDATPRNYDAVGAAYGHEQGIGLAEELKRQLNMRSLHASQALVTWCDWARRSLVDDYGIPPERITVIAPGINLDVWPRPAFREQGGPVRILFVGADFTRKGGETLLQAFRLLSEDCELHLVTKERLDAESGIHVYRDLAPNSDLLKNLYATADIFVLPTLADCFPLVIQEAMAAGLPVVSTAVGAITEAVSDGETGLLVPPDDARSLHAALEGLVGDVARRRAMGRRGREKAEREYDSRANAQRICGIMSGLVEGRQDRNKIVSDITT